MVKLTKEQRKALKRVYDRGAIYPYVTPEELRQDIRPVALTYKQFRRTVRQGPGCAMVRWGGMLLGIEPDGYTHS